MAFVFRWKNSAMTNIKIGKLPPHYTFILNPYPDERLSKCPKCHRPTHLRKFAVFIHIDEWEPMTHGKTCRYWTYSTEAATRPHLPFIAREGASSPPRTPRRHRIRATPDTWPSSSPRPSGGRISQKRQNRQCCARSRGVQTAWRGILAQKCQG